MVVTHVFPQVFEVFWAGVGGIEYGDVSLPPYRNAAHPQIKI